MASPGKLKLCSLLPSATEIIFALGLQEQLVGITHECDFPPEARLKPWVTSSRISPAMQSKEIDEQVRAHLTEEGTLYHLDFDTLNRLSPDIIFTQQLCTVCAVSYEDVCRISERLESHPQVINLEPNSLEEILESILFVGKLTHTESRAEQVIHSLRERIQAVRREVRGLQPKRVLCLEWLDPFFCAGHWIPEIVEIAGGYDEMGKKHKPSVQVAQEEILLYNPDVIIVMCCGFSVERSLQEAVLLQKPEFASVNATQNGNVYITDGSSYFSRPGPRIVDSIEITATILHSTDIPARFSPDIVQQLDILETI